MLHSNATSGATDTSVDPGSSSATATFSASQPSASGDSRAAVHSLSASAKFPSRTQVLLATAWVTASVAFGRAITVRALLDQGSERTFVTENLAQILRAKRLRTPVAISAVGGIFAGTSRYAIGISVSPRESREPAFSTNALVLKDLTSYAPKHLADVSALSHLADLNLADSDLTSSDSISLIVGADLYSDILFEGLRKGEIGQPIAQHTIFGWVVSGPIGASVRDPSFHPTGRRSVSRVSVNHCLSSPSLDEELRKFWEMEEIPRRPILSAEDDRCERHFKSTHSREADGRYVVRLPFKTEPPIDLGNSRNRALQILSSLLRRLSSQPNQLAEYSAFLEEYERLGHMRKISSSANVNSQRVYIPHHPVFREGSATTHLRVVFNASSVASSGSSLNEHLLSGPKLQADLPEVILKWRQFRYVYTADIAKMNRQILLDPRDTKFQCILWHSSRPKCPTEYELLTVTYGMTCAPFLALRVLKQLESDEGAHFPLAAPVLREHIFVDDVLFGGDNPATVRQMREQLVSLLRRGGFNLRKWASNSPSLLADIDPSDHGLDCKTFSPDETLKVLGLGWSPARDAFQVTVALGKDPPESKRSILSAIAKFFDPLGWITPVTITAKIFMQQLWREKIDWDEAIPVNLSEQWSRIYARFPCLNGLQISRWTVLEEHTREHAELHGFADASRISLTP